MRNLVLIALSLLAMMLVGCHKPNPHPETLDPIFGDLEKEKKELEGAIGAEVKQLDEFRAALSEVKPQTGQIKYAQKRVNDSAARLEKLRQRRDYLTLRMQTRKELVTSEYLKAFEKNEEWPNPKEYELYKSQRKLETSPRAWNVNERLQMAAPPKPKATDSGHH